MLGRHAIGGVAKMTETLAKSLEWLWGGSGLPVIVISLVLIGLLLMRMFVSQGRASDTPVDRSEIDRMIQLIEQEAKSLERKAMGVLRAEVRKFFLGRFWSLHEQIIADVKAARLRKVMERLVKMGELQDDITDRMERSHLPADDSKIHPSSQAGLLINGYGDRLMRILGPHLRHHTIQQVGRATRQEIDPDTGRVVK